MAQQGSPPHRSSRQLEPGYAGRHDRSPRLDRPRRGEREDLRGWQGADPFAPDTDTELPSWAGPDDYEPRPNAAGRRAAPSRPDDEEYYDAPDGYRHADSDHGEPSSAVGARVASRRRGRAAATRLRKSRRRVYRWCGVAIVACVVAAGIAAILLHHTPKPALYVTSLQPGEYKAAPDACTSVSTTVLNQYLPEPGRTSTSELSGSTDSQCSFTLDRKPTFLVLEVTTEAYQPFAAASAAGSPPGSASANAQDSYALAMQDLKQRTTHSPLSPAQITALPGLGQQAFVAVQRERVSGIDSEKVTVVVRERNVLITVWESGQESGHGFGPVPVPTLQAGAEAAARDVLAKARTEPTA
ncbi:MAG TPA: hypothetical protein VME44_07210 [Streptosporangiaceae bacterium]|nr:hypothetical protein [Streptosporangiaceae bacterium]